MQTAVDHFGRLDAVVSNAGIFDTAAFDDLTADDWRRMLNVYLSRRPQLGYAQVPRSSGRQWCRKVSMSHSQSSQLFQFIVRPPS